MVSMPFWAFGQKIGSPFFVVHHFYSSHQIGNETREEKKFDANQKKKKYDNEEKKKRKERTVQEKIFEKKQKTEAVT
jgi:hypothetical protein